MIPPSTAETIARFRMTIRFVARLLLSRHCGVLGLAGDDQQGNLRSWKDFEQMT
jgi:hypothetical protein